MSASTTTFRAASPLTRSAGRLATALSLISLAIVVLLHVLEPEYEPTWRLLSEYAVGAYGWLMGVAFLALALACLALLVSLRNEARGITARLGLAFLFTAGIGLGLAAFYAIDPITIDPSQATDTGRMHALSAMIGIPSMPLSALLLSIGLGRRPGWSGARAPLFWTAILTLVSLVLMFVVIGTLLPQNGGFGPAVIVGLPNRLLMLTYYVWVAIAGWQVAGLARS